MVHHTLVHASKFSPEIGDRLGMLMSIPVTGIAYWCIDQEMVQRVLAARDLGEARIGTSLAGVLKFLPPFITGKPMSLTQEIYLKHSSVHHQCFLGWLHA